MSAAKTECDTAKSNFDAAWMKFLDHKNCGIKIRDDLSAEVSKAEGELRRLEEQHKYYEGQHKGISSVYTMATTLRSNYS